MEVAGLLLMGGKATRMQGRQKAFLYYQDKTFYQHSMESLQSLKTIYISVAKDTLYKDIVFPLIVDRYPEIGPLGGICSALEQCKEDALFVLPCDVPKISSAIVESMVDIYQKSKQPIIIKDGDCIHPLIGIYPKEVVPCLQKQIVNQQYQVKEFVKKMKFQMLDIREIDRSSEELVNINSLEDLQKIQ